ncbi:Hsp20/alpha crystallin family protein [Chloroflexota bacterium]
MVVQRWDPFSELRQMQETMNRLRQSGSVEGEDMETWAIPLDVTQDGEDFVVRASVPGVDPDDMKISIEDNVLGIRCHTVSEHAGEGNNGYLLRERRTGSFYRALRLPDSVDTEKANPVYENGVLTVTIPRAESKKAKELKVTVVGSSGVLAGNN